MLEGDEHFFLQCSDKNLVRKGTPGLHGRRVQKYTAARDFTEHHRATQNPSIRTFVCSSIFVSVSLRSPL